MDGRRILFIDVDGTLVDYSGRLPESAVRAIRQARGRGHRVYISTGRSKAEVYAELWEIGLDGMIGGNGSYVEDHGHVVMHQHLSAEECRRIVDWLQGRGLEFYLESNQGLFASDHFEERGRAAIQAYSAGKRNADATILTVREAFPDMIFGGGLYRDDVNKVSFVLNSDQDYLDVKEAFPDMMVNTWGGKGGLALFGDIGVRGITKANAIAHLLKYLGETKENTIAFGDADADIPMFEYCRIGVCMGNGGEAAKAAADYVAEAVECDGLYLAFRHLGLAEDCG